MTVTDEFTKAITLMAGKATFNGPDWAVILLDRLHLVLLEARRAIISGRDSKIVGQLRSTYSNAVGSSLSLPSIAPFRRRHI